MMDQVPQQPVQQNYPQQPVQPNYQQRPAQPVYQQPPVQPHYQQPVQQGYPQYPYQQYRRPAGEGVKNFVESFAKFLPKLAVIFTVIAAMAFLYHFIFAIIDAADAEEFRIFCEEFVSGIAATAKYVFFAAMSVLGAKLLKK